MNQQQPIGEPPYSKQPNWYVGRSGRTNLQCALKYYRRRKRNGESWIPAHWTKVHIWCQQHGIDTIKLITGEEKLNDAMFAE